MGADDFCLLVVLNLIATDLLMANDVLVLRMMRV